MLHHWPYYAVIKSSSLRFSEATGPEADSKADESRLITKQRHQSRNEKISVTLCRTVANILLRSGPPSPALVNFVVCYGC
jgi:hypothetical protein